MNNLLAVNNIADIPVKYQNTSIGLLLEYHNLNRSFENYPSAKMLIGMCMDNRNNLKVPDNFAFVMRAGGANFQANEFHISYALAVAGLNEFALIGHSDCGMENLVARKSNFVNGLVEVAGLKKESAELKFARLAPKFEVHNAADFILCEVKRLRLEYPAITIAPLFYRVEDKKLYLIKEE